MKAADVITSIAAGACISGIGIATVYAIVGFVNSRIDKRRTSAKPVAVQHVWTAFLDWLTRFVLGPKRMDHEPAYSCAVSAVFLVSGAFLAVGPTSVSAISGIADTTQIVLSACMFAGSGTCLYGITMGTFADTWRAVVRVKRRALGQPAQPQMDPRRSYRVGASGTPSIVVSLLYYAALVGRHNPLLIGESVFLGFIALGMFFQCLRFLMEIRRINQTLLLLIEQEIARREIAGGISPGSTGKPGRRWRRA